MPLFTLLWKQYANHLGLVFCGTGACWPHFSLSFDTSFVPNGLELTKIFYKNHPCYEASNVAYPNFRPNTKQ